MAAALPSGRTSASTRSMPDRRARSPPRSGGCRRSASRRRARGGAGRRRPPPSPALGVSAMPRTATGRPSIGDEDRRPAVRGERVGGRVEGAGRLDASDSRNPARPTRTRRPSTTAGDALPGGRSRSAVRRRIVRPRALDCLAHDRVGERMLGSALGRGGQREQLVLVQVRRRRRTTSVTRRPALGERAGLVEHDHPHGAEPLESLGVAEQDPGLGALARADHDRGRRGEPEGARAGDDQDRDGVEQREVERRLRPERAARRRTSARRGRARPARNSRSRRRRGAGSAPASPAPPTRAG